MRHNTETTPSINSLRSWLRDIARKRVRKTVTADDAHRYFDKVGVANTSIDVRLSYINSVLRKPNFIPVGMVPSKRAVARKRHITEWAI